MGRRSSPCSRTGDTRTGTAYEEELFSSHLLRAVQNYSASGTADPLFLMYAPHLVHSPYQIPANWLAKFDFIKEKGKICGFLIVERSPFPPPCPGSTCAPLCHLARHDHGGPRRPPTGARIASFSAGVCPAVVAQHADVPSGNAAAMCVLPGRASLTRSTRGVYSIFPPEMLQAMILTACGRCMLR